MIQSSKKDSYYTNCLLDCGSFSELHHVINSFNTSTGICTHVKFYIWKQTLFLFLYLFPYCLCFYSFISLILLPEPPPYFWDPPLSKQTFIVCSWISAWVKETWNSEFVIVIMADATCGSLGWFGSIFFKVLLTEEKDTGSDFLSFCLSNRFGSWMNRESDPWRQLHQQAGVISSSSAERQPWPVAESSNAE